ncbi:hypothetical protein C8F01DRAFT_1246940 [Mycena amicta]|nr:hypothetical protein C8F01DRAFT_1246940 [Mycena amicta]
MTTRRQKRNHAQVNTSLTPLVNMSMDELFGGPSLAPMTTFVERMSNDKKRRYQEAVPVNPPSPMKHQYRQATSAARTARSVFSVEDEAYTMDLDGWGDGDASGRESTAPKDTAAVKPSDPALNYWLLNHRDDYLRLFLWHDGRGAMDADSCPECGTGQAVLYRCEECMDARLLCRECCSAAHGRQPLHHISEWNGFFFHRTTLKKMGLRIQFGHGGARCVRPVRGHEDFVVLHHNGVHEVAVDFCGCERREDDFKQLLRAHWFPVTTGRPQTCATFQCLDAFHTLSLQAKTTAYDFYAALELRTNGHGLKPPNRYPAFLRMMREYRHVILLKRRGRFGHDGSRASDTGLGELAIRCPACPRPGVNLPSDWESAAPEDMCLYILFIAMDACFRLKRRMVSSERRDPALGAGWAYMVETAPYREFLLTMTDQKEMSTCSGLAALDYANTKFSRGYSATGVGMGVCARHEIVLPTGVGDLQKGERYANMDYIFASMLRHISRLLRMIVSYDIVCQWWKQLKERLLQLPPLVRLQLALDFVRFVVPKMHINGHTLSCQVKYSLNLVPGSGQTDAEGIERAWAVVGGLAGSTRLMGPGSRSDTLDDHWSFWNWLKLLGLAATLRRRLDVAEAELAKQKEAFELFSEEQVESIGEWRDMVEVFEADGSKKNPYESTMKGLTEAQVRGKLEEEEEKEEGNQRRAQIHEVGPVAFVVAGLAAEDEQRRLRVQVALKKANSTVSKGKLRLMRRKVNRSIQRLRGLQATYTPAALVRLEALSLAEDILPESVPLLLPSSLLSPLATGVSGEASEALLELVAIERQLCEAQCRTALVQLRNQLHIKSRLLLYKRNHSRHQTMNTRSRAVVARNESHIRLHSEKYQMAWNALVSMVGGSEAEVGWKKLEKADIRCMQEGETFSRKEAERQRKEKKQLEREARLRAEGELGPIRVNDEEMEVEEEEEDAERFTEGQNRSIISWIWTSTGSQGTDAEIREGKQASDAAWARVRRWDEEVRMLKEEFRRLPVSFKHEEQEWNMRAASVPLGSIPTQEAEGMIAYALKQASMYRSLGERVEITRSEEKLGRGYRRRRYYPAERGFATELGAAATEEGADGSDSEGEDERGDLDSEEELLVGGELDDE